MRLIDADKLIKTIEEHDYPLADECNSIDRGMFTIGIMQAIDEQPHVDFDEINNKRTEFCDYVYDLFSDEPTKYIRYLTTDKCDIKYERFKQDMESCERSLISTIEFWQPAVDGKTAVEKVKADIRAERGVQP